ncbi:hypothetical protein BKA61DRAFT_288696 [Leptodontidium sp. MPI-SDFR-AT-0119]|nr:hypothetical protein BKA61DRAFT_288696 [Leptodontidium sp. MPI-SDFR-AT-0119]
MMMGCFWVLVGGLGLGLRPGSPGSCKHGGLDGVPAKLPKRNCQVMCPSTDVIPPTGRMPTGCEAVNSGYKTRGEEVGGDLRGELNC